MIENSDTGVDKGEVDHVEEPSPLFEYLQSPSGHELASRIVTLIEEIKKATLDRGAEQAKLNIELSHKHQRSLLVLQGLVFTVAIIAATFLTYVGKFEPAVAILFGTLVGYFFGRRSGAT